MALSTNAHGFRQLFDPATSTYTYLLWDIHTRDAVIIDSVSEQHARDVRLLEELGLKLKWILETHVHADHVTGADLLRTHTQAKVGISKNSGVVCADRLLVEDDRIEFGSCALEVMATPGHTDSCLSYRIEDRVMTGDALLIRACGRTDFQQGSSERLYQSITEKLFTLPQSTRVYPGHDYTGQLESTVGEEKRFNPRLGGGRTVEQFAAFMKARVLDPPKQIHVAVPANMRCGKIETENKENA